MAIDPLAAALLAIGAVALWLSRPSGAETIIGEADIDHVVEPAKRDPLEYRVDEFQEFHDRLEALRPPSRRQWRG